MHAHPYIQILPTLDNQSENGVNVEAEHLTCAPSVALKFM